MGLESRDWYREQPDEGTESTSWLRWSVIAGAAIATAVIVAFGAHLLYGPAQVYGGENVDHGRNLSLSLLPGGPKLSLSRAWLYPKNDPWKRYLASEKQCPNGERTDLSFQAEATVMVCLVNYAREQRRLSPLTVVAFLNETSVEKAARIVRCTDFNHNACRIDAAEEVRAGGYTGAWGENLVIASGRIGAPRPALDSWLNSPHHRENLFDPHWKYMGLAVQHLDRFGADKDMWLWVNQFGDR
jgi:uncharacterized protein YkwD